MSKKKMQKTARSPFLTVIEAANYLGVKRSTLDHYRCEGRGPKYRKHGWRVMYPQDELDRWSKSREYSSTSTKAP